MVGAVALAALPSPAAADITTGLTAHYEFDEGTGTAAADSSGNGNGGTLTNGPTWVSGQVGDGALDFDGVDDFVVAGSDFVGTGADSVCLWIKPDALTHGVGLVDNFARFSLFLLLSNRVAFTGNGNNSANSEIDALVVDEWQHVCATRDADGLATLYVNGAQSGTPNSNSGTPTAGLGPVSVGARSDGEAAYAGLIDDVRVYSRALSAGDVIELYVADATVPGAPTSVSAVKGNTTAAVSFTAPADDGGTAVIRYTATSNPGGVTATSTASPITVTGLTNGVEYTFTVTATNLVGTSTASSASNAVTPDDIGNTIVADSCSLEDVQDAVDAAIDGDTVQIPAGTCEWTATLTVDNAITLEGAGVGNTIIEDAVVGDELMNWFLVANLESRMTGIEFQDGGRSGSSYIVNFQGSNTNGSQLRVDHNKFDNLNGFSLVPNDVIGVIDHNEFIYEGGGIAIYAFHKNWNDEGGLGGGSWADVTHFGTSQFLFIEDNTFQGPCAAYDNYGGARLVFRYNAVNSCFLETHGTDSAGIFRGGRAFEVYNNTFDGPTIGNYITNGRSGTYRIHGNEINGNDGAKFTLVYYRAAHPFSPWGAMDGYSPWDLNDPGNPFFTGTADSGTASGGTFNSPTVTVDGAGWEPDEWVGYVLKKTSAESSVQKASLILENTADTVTYYASGFTASMTFAEGDTFEINRVLRPIDLPSVGQGSLLAAEDPPVVPDDWNDQVVEPSYQWDNDGGENDPFFSAYANFVREGEHYFEDTEAPGYTTYIYPHPLVVADSTAPSVSITSPDDDEEVSGSVGIVASVFDSGGIAGVQFQIDGANEGAEDTTSTYGITWDTTEVADGAHTVSAIARDEAGNRATTSVTVTVANDVEAGGGDDEEEEEPRRRGGGGGGGGRRSADTAVATSSPAQAGFRFARDLDVGASGEDVRQLQILLNARGFAVAASGPGSAGQETTLFGGLTRAALARFQAASGISPALGYFGPKTRAALGGAAAPSPTPQASSVPAAQAEPVGRRDLELGASGADVLSLQRLLVALDSGPAARALAAAGPSGNFGALTQAAVIEIQTAKGISPASGYFGPKTKAALGI
jgi:peptidoglycan hydrolase-like protein with peptidoglycan-binding domain